MKNYTQLMIHIIEGHVYTLHVLRNRPMRYYKVRHDGRYSLTEYYTYLGMED